MKSILLLEPNQVTSVYVEKPLFIFTWLEGGLHAAIPVSCAWGSFG